MSSSVGVSGPRDQIHASCITGRFFTTEPRRKPFRQYLFFPLMKTRKTLFLCVCKCMIYPIPGILLAMGALPHYVHLAPGLGHLRVLTVVALDWLWVQCQTQTKYNILPCKPPTVYGKRRCQGPVSSSQAKKPRYCNLGQDFPSLSNALLGF